MIVFNLGCTQEHQFEGWFANAADYATQLDQGLLSCPVCGDHKINKRLSAPRLNLSSAASPSEKMPNSVVAQDKPTIEQMQSLWFKVAAQIMRNTEDVGDRFAQEARKIHYNEAPERAIRGIANEQERRELQDEGIEIFALPLPASAKETLQ
jgi:hypothetical protein